ncbi:MAG: type II toxin-antitoxin system VapC family toxin [Rhodanobacteraceae bacterium]
MILVDTCVWLDLLQDDPEWCAWSAARLEWGVQHGGVAIAPVIYAELSVWFERIEALDAALRQLRATFDALPREALFLAGKAFRLYRARGGTRASVLPDFFVGAHAAVRGWPVVTRDVARIRGYFSKVALLAPDARPEA